MKDIVSGTYMKYYEDMYSNRLKKVERKVNIDIIDEVAVSRDEGDTMDNHNIFIENQINS